MLSVPRYTRLGVGVPLQIVAEIRQHPGAEEETEPALAKSNGRLRPAMQRDIGVEETLPTGRGGVAWPRCTQSLPLLNIHGSPDNPR